MSLSNRIKEARKKAGLTQKALGAKIGTSEAVIGQYEIGYRRPKYDTLQRISEVLGLEIGYFFADFNDSDVRDIIVEEFSVSTLEFDKKLQAIGWVATLSTEVQLPGAEETWELSNGAEKFYASKSELQQIDRETDSFLQYKIYELRSKRAGGN